MANEKKRSVGFEAAQRLINEMVTNRTVSKSSSKKSSGTTTESEAKTYTSPEEYVTDRLNRLGLNKNHVNQDYINSFLKDAQDYLNNSESKYSGMGWANSKSTYEEQSKKLRDLQSKSWSIRQYLKKNKSAMKEEDYASFMTLLDDFEKTSTSNDYAFYKKNEAFSQFDNEAAYKEHMRQQGLNGMTSEELKEAQKGRTLSDEDMDIVYSLSQSLVPYDWDTAKANGVDKLTFDEDERKRKYIEDKFGVDLHYDIYDNVNIYNGLMNGEKIAYTTADGYNIKWEDLPNDRHSSKNISIPLNKGLLLEVLNQEKITAKSKLIEVRIKGEEGFNPQTDLRMI